MSRRKVRSAHTFFAQQPPLNYQNRVRSLSQSKMKFLKVIKKKVGPKRTHSCPRLDDNMADDQPVMAPAEPYRKVVSFAEYVDEISASEHKYEEDLVESVYRFGRGQSVVVSVECNDTPIQRETPRGPAQASQTNSSGDLQSTPSDLVSLQEVLGIEKKSQGVTQTLQGSLDRVLEALNDMIAPPIPMVASCSANLCYEEEDSDSDESPIATEPPKTKAVVAKQPPAHTMQSIGSAFQPVRRATAPRAAAPQQSLEYSMDEGRPNKPYRRKDAELDDCSSITTEHSAFQHHGRVLVVPPTMNSSMTPSHSF